MNGQLHAPADLLPGIEISVPIGYEGARCSGDITPPIFISALVGGEWSAANLLFLYPWGENPRHTLDRRLNGPHSRSERCRVEKEFFARAENRTPAVQPLARTFLTIPADPSWRMITDCS
jgi:hypothetical protein